MVWDSNSIFGGVMCSVGILFIGFCIWAILQNDIWSVLFGLIGGFLILVGFVQLLMIKMGLYEPDSFGEKNCIDCNLELNNNQGVYCDQCLDKKESQQSRTKGYLK